MRLLLFICCLFVPCCFSFKLSFRSHAVCTAGTPGFCLYTPLRCEGTVVTFPQGRGSMQLCMSLSSVTYQEVGVQHLFSLAYIYDRHTCSHQSGLQRISASGFGKTHLLVTILAKGDHVMDVPCDGQVARVRQGNTIVTLCAQLSAWDLGNLLRQYTVRTEPQCDLQVRGLFDADDFYIRRDEL